MLIRSLLFIFLGYGLIACGNDAKFSQEELAEQDTAWKAMMKVHDNVMPMQIKDIPDVTEELEELAKAARVEASDFHPRAQEAITNLNAAYEGMNTWMDAIGSKEAPKPKAENFDHTAIMAFIKEQTVFINKVSDDMQSSVAAGRALIETRKRDLPNE